MEIEIEAVTFGDLLAKFQENGLILKLVTAPDDPTSFTLVARPDPKRSNTNVGQAEKLSSSES